MLSTIKFVLKQLLPLKYETTYRIVDDNGNDYLRMHCTWRMWLFKPFHIQHSEILNSQ